MLDVAGHYARPDVFELIVHRGAHPIIRVAQDPPGRFMEDQTPIPLEPRKERKRQRDKRSKK